MTETSRPLVGRPPAVSASSHASSSGLAVPTAAALIIAECVGTGVLALPANAHTLGLTLTLVSLTGTALLTMVAAVMLHRAASTIEVLELREPLELYGARPRPRVPDYYLLAVALYGERSLMARVTIFAFHGGLFLMLGVFLVVMSKALVPLLSHAGWDVCEWQAGLICTLVMAAVNQMPSLIHIGRGPAYFSVVAIVVVCGVCVAGLPADRGLTPAAPAAARPLPISAALSGVVFAMGVMPFVLSTRHALDAPARIVPSLGVAICLLALSYALLIVLAGKHPPAYLLDAIASEAGSLTASLLLLAHVAISYAICSVMLCSALERELLRRTRQKFTPAHCCRKPRVRWALLTSFVMFVAWAIANGAPFFGDLVNLIGAITGAPLAFLAPPLFHLRARKLTGARPTLGERALTAVMVLLASALAVMGTIGAVVGIVHHWQAYGWPFECHAR